MRRLIREVLSPLTYTNASTKVSAILSSNLASLHDLIRSKYDIWHLVCTSRRDSLVLLRETKKQRIWLIGRFSSYAIFRYGESFLTSLWDSRRAYIYGTPSPARGATSQNGPARYLWCSPVPLSITRFISMLFVDCLEKQVREFFGYNLTDIWWQIFSDVAFRVSRS